MLRSGDRKSLSSPTRTSLRLHGTVLTTTATGTCHVDKTAEAGVRYTYTVRGVNKDSVRSLGYNKTGVSAVLSKRKALTQHGEQRRITEKAPSGTAGGGFLVVGYKSDLRLDRGVAKTRSEGHMNRRC